ncbi:MAG: membrane dipeptidase [Verrucomicrobiales bacterium]|jgi:membrane dipeptidase
MGSWITRAAVGLAGLGLIWCGWPILGVFVASWTVGFWILDRSLNPVASIDPVEITAEAAALHEGSIVVDLHADICLWTRDLNKRHRRGHVDLPRLREGGVGLQFVTVPTKLVLSKRAPRLFFTDLFFWRSMISIERPDRWFKTASRARLQLKRARQWVANSDGELVLIRTREELANIVRRRNAGEAVIGIMLGLEGAHALRDGINVAWLADNGFRVLGLAHFNDNRFADSGHGWRRRGLSAAGRELCKQLEAQAITIDLSHASEAAIDDVFAMHAAGELSRPLIVSHTGVRGAHDHQRNILDRQAIGVAQGCGLIGVSFFKPALARADVDAIVETVNYVIALLDDAGLEGARHVALGSDFDGAVKTVIDAAGWPQITQKLLDSGLSEEHIKLVLGGNAVRFFEENLPG